MHADHITGTGELKKLSGCKSVISRASGANADILVDEKDIISFGNHRLRILSTPGHTNGCVTYYIPEQVSVKTFFLPQARTNKPTFCRFCWVFAHPSDHRRVRENPGFCVMQSPCTKSRTDTEWCMNRCMREVLSILIDGVWCVEPSNRRSRRLETD